MHPEIVDDDGGGGFAYVFADDAEVSAGVGSAFGKFGFAIELMGDSGVLGHLAGMGDGGFGENGIEADGRKPLIGAGFVGGGEKILLGYGEVTIGLGDTSGLEVWRGDEQSESKERERFHQ
jgi:hypothetical protein